MAKVKITVSHKAQIRTEYSAQANEHFVSLGLELDIPADILREPEVAQEIELQRHELSRAAALAAQTGAGMTGEMIKSHREAFRNAKDLALQSMASGQLVMIRPALMGYAAAGEGDTAETEGVSDDS